MGLKTIPFRDIEDKAENMYEAVSKSRNNGP